MSYKWDEHDKKIWESNQVLKELESRMARIGLELAKRAQVASEKLKQIDESATKANQNIKELVQTVKTDVASDEELIESEPLEIPPTEAEQQVARESLIKELREMAIEASRNGNTKLAYKIERTVDEIIYEE